MAVNLHERRFSIPADRVGELIDSIAEPDGVWPSDQWPAMRMDDGLQVGSVGGHGPIRYTVDEYVPHRRVRFRFSAPRGFDGWHELAVVPAGDGCDLRHTLSVDPHGLARVSWPLAIRPLHDALMEDAFDEAASSLGLERSGTRRSRWVGWLRRALRSVG